MGGRNTSLSECREPSKSTTALPFQASNPNEYTAPSENFRAT